ncbi:discoidin domain-containing protein [Jiangella asiatica]|uniref:Discoidin domain-containing protein n=1 Tax=Jiangella asiatica TaxID=2530372 RepID=A0A4R5DUG4_9ACTN|nr:discoidin domain-containing protein [Jiangella asiatica]TDE15781.1 discoidin domain-containing protein [Jiangella asiatica]
MTIDYRTPLGPVVALSATPQEGPARQAVVLDWTPPAGGRVLDHYMVYGSPRPGFTAREAELVVEAPVSRYVHAGLGPDPETWHYRVVGIDAAGNVGAFERSPLVTSTTPASFVVGATASSQFSDDYAARFAADGSMSSRWAAAYTDDEWIQVELARPIATGRVELHWQGAYARDYDLLVSPDGAAWTVAREVRGKATAAPDAHEVDGAGEFRFVRMHGRLRATQWGFSIWEFWVFPATPG